MLYGSGVLALVELGLLVYCVLNVITTPEAEVRNLPKLLWLVLVVLIPIVGSIAWLVAGRPQKAAVARPPRVERARAASPDDDEAFLRSLRERAERQRRAEQERRAGEQE